MAGLGAGAGAFTGDVERAKLALQREKLAMQAHNAAVQANQNQQRIDMEAEKRRQDDMERGYRLDRLVQAGEEEDRHREAFRKLRESSLGNAIIAGEMNGGFLKNSQLAMFNQDVGTTYDVAGKFNPVTGKKYQDGLWHFLQFKRKDGQVMLGPDGQPLVELDHPVDRQSEMRIMMDEFGRKHLSEMRGGNGNGFSFEDRLALEQLKQEGLNQRAAAANDARKELAGQRADVQREGIASREKIAGMQMSGRKDIANIQAAVQRAGFLSRENIAKLQEAGRMERATQRNELGWAKYDDASAKWKASYEVAMKRAKNEEERNRITEKYNDGRNAIAEGRLDLDWDKYEETSRHNRATEGIQQQRADTDQYRAETAADLGQQRIDLASERNRIFEDAQKDALALRKELGEKNYDLKVQELKAKLEGKINTKGMGKDDFGSILAMVPKLMEIKDIEGEGIDQKPVPRYATESDAIKAAAGIVSEVRAAAQKTKTATQQPAAQQPAAKQQDGQPVIWQDPKTGKKYRINFENGKAASKTLIQ